MVVRWLPAVLIAWLCCACGGAKRGLADGRYRSEGKPVQVQLVEDTIHLMDAGGGIRTLPMMSREAMSAVVLVRPSMDVDVLTAPLKYRLATGNARPRLETQLGGLIYFGRRMDRYRLTWPDLGFASRARKEAHIGLSMGLFVGLGGVQVAPWTTGNRLEEDYTGVAASAGCALIGAVGGTTLGAAIGWDHLLNDQHRVWIYEGRPWLGLVFGVNLN